MVGVIPMIGKNDDAEVLLPRRRQDHHPVRRDQPDWPRIVPGPSTTAISPTRTTTARAPSRPRTSPSTATSCPPSRSDGPRRLPGSGRCVGIDAEPAHPAVNLRPRALLARRAPAAVTLPPCTWSRATTRSAQGVSPPRVTWRARRGGRWRGGSQASPGKVRELDDVAGRERDGAQPSPGAAQRMFRGQR